MNSSSNRLGAASSAYLRQHADNPVHWRPWDADALAEAEETDRPILLSIGYSACHWCHVMAHESFEDPETAELMNRLYVNIKVDREERPDLDRIYQLAHQLLTRRGGGWPLTVILTPRGHAPIFAGTYFPRDPRPGMPTFRRILTEVEAHYRAHRDEMDGHVEALRMQLEHISSTQPVDEPGEGANAASSILEHVDWRYGGFGQAPKFPHGGALACLLDASRQNADKAGEMRKAISLTLDGMSAGGLFDQVGGGFFRYSVDDAWQVPHFEKMLYDNALLMALYADAAIEMDNTDWRITAIETGTWALGEMQLDHGGFASSLDADSEGSEGRFYLWSPGELDAALPAVEKTLADALFHLDGPPNFEGRFHLARRCPLTEAAAAAGLDSASAESTWQQIRARLRAQREARTRPARDDKCLTSWNALMIGALARTGRLLGRPDFVAGADRALDFLRRAHARDGRLQAASHDGRAYLSAYLDDYVYLADALLEMLQCRWRDEDLQWCRDLVDLALSRFGNPARGLFFTADDHESLLVRPRVAADDATPSGNGVAARVLIELGHLVGETRYLEAASDILRAFSREVTAHPIGHAALLEALTRSRRPTTRVILRGDDTECGRWAAQVARRQGRFVNCYPLGSAKSGGLAGQPGEHGVTAWVCNGSHCLAPVTDSSALQECLDETVQ